MLNLKQNQYYISTVSVFCWFFSSALLMSYSGRFKLVPATVIYACFVGLALLKANEWRPVGRSAKTMISFVVSFSFFYIVSLAYTSCPNYGGYKVFRTIIFVVITLVLLRNKPMNCIVTNFYASIVILVLVFISYGSPFELWENIDRYYRLGIEDGVNPIRIARGLGFSAISICFFCLSRKRHVLYGWVLCIVVLLYMFFSGSKGPILSLVLAFIYAELLRNRYGKLRVRRFFLGFCICVFIFYLSIVISDMIFYDGFLGQRFIGNTGSYDSRLDLYSLIFTEVRQFSIAELLGGRGVGSYAMLSIGADERFYPHNLILELLYEVGVIGISLFIAFIVSVYRSRWQGTVLGRYYMCLFIYYLINAQFSGDICSNGLILLFGALVVNISDNGGSLSLRHPCNIRSMA